MEVFGTSAFGVVEVFAEGFGEAAPLEGVTVGSAGSAASVGCGSTVGTPNPFSCKTTST